MKNVSRFVILDPLRKLRTHLKTNTKDASMKEQASVISDVYIRNIFQFQKIYYYFNFPTVPKEISPKTQQYYEKVECVIYQTGSVILQHLNPSSMAFILSLLKHLLFQPSFRSRLIILAGILQSMRASRPRRTWSCPRQKIRKICILLNYGLRPAINVGFCIDNIIQTL